MVNYLITNKGADATRVFAAGMSSGGCMTNTLLAVYPDVFAGGSAMPGVPAGGWPAGDTSCTKCGSQPPNMTGAQWAALATNVFKWSGQYGCSQQWVGGGVGAVETRVGYRCALVAVKHDLGVGDSDVGSAQMFGDGEEARFTVRRQLARDKRIADQRYGDVAAFFVVEHLD